MITLIKGYKITSVGMSKYWQSNYGTRR